MAFVDPDRLYPLLFSPVYVRKLWGGGHLEGVLGREIPPGSPPVGEALEIADREDCQTIVRNGMLSGNTLESLVRYYGRGLVGTKWNGRGRFPLVIKLLDSGQRLSLQVHPDAAYCRNHPDEGLSPKTEMWYIIAHDAGAKVMAGLSPRATRQQLLGNLSSPEVESSLQVYPSTDGDAYFLPAGVIHALGEGNLVLEIQQNSDVTFRLSDWGRLDADGRPRRLHVRQGVEAVDYMNRTTTRIPGVVGDAEHNRKFQLVNRCSDFSADVLKLKTLWRDDTHHASFHLLTAVNKPIKVGRHSETETMEVVNVGETVLIPACFGSYFIVPQRSGTTDVVRALL